MRSIWQTVSWNLYDKSSSVCDTDRLIHSPQRRATRSFSGAIACSSGAHDCGDPRAGAARTKEDHERLVGYRVLDLSIAMSGRSPPPASATSVRRRQSGARHREWQRHTSAGGARGTGSTSRSCR